MTVAVLAGAGAKRLPTLAELEWAAEAIADRGATIVRHDGQAKFEAAWIRARGLAAVELWQGADGDALLDGRPPGQLIAERPASFVVRFEGGRSGVSEAYGRGMHVHYIHERPEPRAWNRHHGNAPGPWIYCGRGTPVGNEFVLELQPGETRAQASDDPLRKYRDWLRERIVQKSRYYDPKVVEWIKRLTPGHYIVCSCLPYPCHAEFIIRAWRWLTKEPTT
ncbi:MAG TPA: DUF4326 domain-containing protein [Enhygromyxa sp.]|jgi:hypothetical protein|nr:DUF4326 domain-containing protein [Enhygromyxa sp.]